MVDTGLAKAGYKYVNLDDCWQSGRGSDGRFIVDNNFPNAIKALADYADEKGLLFGFYSDQHKNLCRRAWIIRL